jgi:lipopolysaccharide/colanic/teichoic acid biosynthesis glycosyltransferase/RimJ/RimL family protein N-acetyltransferase
MSLHRRILLFTTAKRLMGLLVLLLLGPFVGVVASVVAVLVRTVMGKPILFRQARLGYREKTFTVFKFRTMTNACNSEGVLLPDDQRITRLGRFLRLTSLDELPQLWNVLIGDMALIGPRPLLVDYQPWYTTEERLRHAVRPGITGLAQVSGRNWLGWDERLALDVHYVKRASIVGDMHIAVRTLKVVFLRRGVSVVPGDTGERLDVIRSYPRSNGLALRRFLMKDIQTRVSWLNDDRVTRNMSIDKGITVESTIRWLRHALSDPNRRDFVVYRESDATVLAMLGLRQRTADNLPELYIMVGPNNVGKGFGTAALGLLLSWAKTSSEWGGCTLNVVRTNTAAVRLYKRYGFCEATALPNNRMWMKLQWG